VYDLSEFANLHPGGVSVLLAKSVGACLRQTLQFRRFLIHVNPAGQDATNAFYGLHRQEVLSRPQYARLVIGRIQGEEETIEIPIPGTISKVPYAEATWLADGFHTPYFKESHRKFHKAIRTFFEEVVRPEALRCEDSGKRISQEVVDKLR